MKKIETKLMSSLAKVFLDETPKESTIVGTESLLYGESYAFQVAYKHQDTVRYEQKYLKLNIISDISDYLQIRYVKNVPVMLASWATKDEFYLKDGKPGMYPDLLENLSYDNEVFASSVLWQSIHVEFTPTKEVLPGTHIIKIQFVSVGGKDVGEILGEVETCVKLINKVLPKQDLKFTQWFHADCLSTYYNVTSLSDKHFELIEKFIKTAVRNGVNMILVPLFTPPLDVDYKGDRPTVQLVKVVKKDKLYTFDFSFLDRYINICLEAGVEFFEMSHLFTQWGAKYAPKIFGTVNGMEQQIFGWDDLSTGEEYTSFLSAFLPELVQYLKNKDIDKNTYFHISDEPSLSNLEQYKKCSEFLYGQLGDFKIIDALSNIDFFNEGCVKTPVVSTYHIEEFLEKDIEERWIYYCCIHDNKVSNRFIAMPSYRNRVIATQIYKFDIDGFLQWGYNFWYSKFSKNAINPFLTTDANMGYEAGDGFSVYPGENGPLESIRIRVFHDALCDLRAMKLLESYTSKEYVLSIIEEGITPIKFNDTPESEEYVLNLRKRINDELEMR